MSAAAPFSVFAPRAERRLSWRMVAALVAAVAFHITLFGALSLGWTTPKEPVPTATPIEVSLVDDVALDQRAPPSTQAPAQSRAPEIAPPEDAAPPPTPEKVEPDPAPLKPLPPKPIPPRSATAAKPAPATPAPPRPTAPATRSVATAKATGSNPTGKRLKPGGASLDADFRAGLVQTATKGKAPVPPAAMDGKAAADIGSAILRQVQPCANRQVNPGPGASRIVVQIRLHLNRDGSLSSRPEIPTDPSGVDDDNRIYVDAVKRNAIATFTGCSPLRGLPDALYDVPRGWKTFSLRYRLPG